MDVIIEVFVKIKKKLGGSGGVGLWGGFRVDVNEELKFCENSKKMGGLGVGGGGSGWGGGGVRVDVIIEVFVKIKKKMGGGGPGGVRLWGGGSGWM